MPNQSDRRRVMLSMRPELYELISRAARVQSKPRGRYVIELLEQVAPTLERIVILSDALDEARNAPARGLEVSAQHAEESLTQAMESAEGQIDMLVDQHVRDTFKAKRNSRRKVQGRAPPAAKSAVGAGRRGSPGKRRHGAVKRSGKRPRAG